jgi:uracil-DNA glycosylase
MFRSVLRPGLPCSTNGRFSRAGEIVTLPTVLFFFRCLLWTGYLPCGSQIFLAIGVDLCLTIGFLCEPKVDLSRLNALNWGSMSWNLNDMVALPYLSPVWRSRLEAELTAPYMATLMQFLRSRMEQGAVIFPDRLDWFAAFNRLGFDDVRVVILGQDPYHGPGQAHGLCFSVRAGVPLPPSLVNIYKELQGDLGIRPSKSGCLLPWAEQGVLLLNSVLTVECGEAGSHQGRGWESFTDAAIRRLASERDGLVFVLWGAYAQKKGAFIDRKRHLVIESPHPSPLSAHRGFLGSRPFSKINQFLTRQGKPPIDWCIQDPRPA